MDAVVSKLEALGAETKDALERFLDDEQMYMKYIRYFPDEPTMPALQKAVTEKDYVAAEKAVHALKGIVNNLGFLPLADAAIDMLEELRDHNEEAALEAFNELEQHYAKFCEVICAGRE